MPINSFLQTQLHAGTINTSATFTKQQNFGSPVNAWSAAYLFMVNSGADGAVSMSISQFKDSTGTHNGPFTPGVIVNNCTSVTFMMATDDCVASAALTTMFF
jgi:hypothetical protein